MNRSTFLGSTAGVLLAFSVISYANTLVPNQDPSRDRAQQTPVSSQQPVAVPATSQAGMEPAKQDSTASGTAPSEGANAASVANSAAERPRAVSTPAGNEASDLVGAAPQTYTATAYSLRGRTASGRYVSRGLIAADPRVLPLGTRVRVEAGSWSGEYLVADTGGAVKGRRIDIWTPTTREALQFGRRAVKLTVLSYGAKKPRTKKQ